MDGISTIGKSSFGTVLVAGRNRVPKPATGMTAFRTFMEKSRSVLDDPSCFSFFDLLAGLAFNAEGGYRTRLETLNSDLFSTFLADTVTTFVEPSQRLLDLEDQFALTITNPQNRVSIRFHGRSVGGIWKIFVLVHILHILAGFRTELLHPLVQKISKQFGFLIGHCRLASLRFRARFITL